MAAILTGSEFEKRENGLKLIKMIKKGLNRQLIVFLANIFSFEIYTVLGKGFYRKPEVKSKALSVAEAFKEGLFMITKTPRRFSGIAIDQTQEQNNALVKGDGGAVGLTENANALRRWMLSGPEMARLVNEFEKSVSPETTPEFRHHHENEKGFQNTFHKDIRALVGVIEEFGNPFEEEGKGLSVSDTKVVADEEGVSRMQNIEELGRKQCDAFIAERLIEHKKPLDDPITRNTLSFFKTPIKKTSKAHQQLSSMNE